MTNAEAVRVLRLIRDTDPRKVHIGPMDRNALTRAIEALEREGDRPAHGEGE